jgi:signal transduction histidine kinase
MAIDSQALWGFGNMHQLYRFVSWAPSLARLFLALAVLGAQYDEGGAIVHPTALLLLAWAASSIGLILVTQLVSKQALAWYLWIDVGAAALATWVAPTTLVESLALLACTSQLLIRAGYSPYCLAVLVVPLCLAPVSAGLADETNTILNDFTTSLGNQIIFALSILTAGASIALSTIRGEQMRQFRDQAVSIRMLRLERSLEFDLQKLVNELASLFGPKRAFCMIGEATQYAVQRRFEAGTNLQLAEHEVRKLIEFGADYGAPELVLDTSNQQIHAFGGMKAQTVPENAKSAVAILGREGMRQCLVKWVRIGRANGIVVCAVTGIDAIALHETKQICQSLNELFPLLDSISEAERNFIADAHDVARRDLHDGVLQTLAAVRMRLLSLARRADVSDQPVQAEVQKIADILTLEQARLRGMLETSESEDHGINLVTALDVALRAISMQWEIDAKLESDERAVPIDKESAINIEHLVREAVANAVRHANSTQLTVRLSFHHNALRIAIIDRAEMAMWGVGKKGGKSMPLKSASLLQRLRLVNGSAYAEGLDKSAILAITIPMQRAEHA